MLTRENEKKAEIERICEHDSVKLFVIFSLYLKTNKVENNYRQYEGFYAVSNSFLKHARKVFRNASFSYLLRQKAYQPVTA